MSSNPAMMKKQKRRHYRHKGKEKIKKPGRLQLLAHPLNGIDPEALKVAILAMAKREIEEFPKLVETMLAQLTDLRLTSDGMAELRKALTAS